MRDESHWYHGGWWGLREALVRLAMKHLDPVLWELEDSGFLPTEERWERAIAKLLDGIRGRIGTAETELAARWEHGMILFSPYREERESRRAAPRRTLASELVACVASDSAGSLRRRVRTTVERYVETSRRELAPGTVDRQRRWEDLRRESEALLKEQGILDPAVRLDDSHHEALAARIRATPDSKLPSTVKTIREYFEEFDPLNRAWIEDFGPAGETLGVERLRDLPDPSPYFDLHRCLDRLDDGYRKVIDAGFDLGPVSYVNQAAFLEQEGMAKITFQRRRAQGLELLRDCLEDGVAEGRR